MLMNESEIMSHIRRLENELRLLKEKHQFEVGCSKCGMKKVGMYENVDDGGEKTVHDQNLNEVCFDFDFFVSAFVDKTVHNVE